MDERLAQVEAWLDHTKSISEFRSAVRSEVRRLWLGEVTAFSFYDGMIFAITRHLTRAWKEGAKECGVNEDEFSDSELRARENLINSQFVYLLGFADDIEENSKASGGLLSPLFDRADMWVRRYDEAKNQAKVMACGDRKLKWVRGSTANPCSDCSKLNGRVYRASVWQRYGLRPQSHSLECGGWRCLCTLQPTDEPMTKGKPPGLKGPPKKKR